MSEDGLIDRGDGRDAILQRWTEDELNARARAACAGYRVDLWTPGLVSKMHTDYAALQAKADRLAEALEKVSDPDSAWIPHLVAAEALADYRGEGKP